MYNLALRCLWCIVTVKPFEVCFYYDLVLCGVSLLKNKEYYYFFIHSFKKRVLKSVTKWIIQLIVECLIFLYTVHAHIFTSNDFKRRSFSILLMFFNLNLQSYRTYFCLTYLFLFFFNWRTIHIKCKNNPLNMLSSYTVEQDLWWLIGFSVHQICEIHFGVFQCGSFSAPCWPCNRFRNCFYNRLLFPKKQTKPKKHSIIGS